MSILPWFIMSMTHSSNEACKISRNHSWNLFPPSCPSPIQSLSFFCQFYSLKSILNPRAPLHFASILVDHATLLQSQQSCDRSPLSLLTRAPHPKVHEPHASDHLETCSSLPLARLDGAWPGHLLPLQPHLAPLSLPFFCPSQLAAFQFP